MKNGNEPRTTEAPIPTGESDPGKSALNAKAGMSEGVRFTRAEIEAILRGIVGGGSVVWGYKHPDTFEPTSATVWP
jgi:hypothetical protein